MTTRHRQRRQAALQRRVAADLLQEQHQEEEQDREARVHRERLDVPRREVAPAEQPQREHRVGGARLVRNEARPAAAIPPISGTTTAGLAQPSRGCSISANTEPAEPARAQQRAGQVDPARARRARARRAGIATRISDDADTRQRDVDQEDQPPRADREQLAADQRPQHPGDRAPRRPAADRPAAL